jgi:phage terminase Nu1 subunit (DNA packaging protein)
VGVKAQLQDLTRDVLAGDLETRRAAVANQLINTRLRAIEQERKNRETEDLEARIEALERAQEKGGPRWRGA